MMAKWSREFLDANIRGKKFFLLKNYSFPYHRRHYRWDLHSNLGGSSPQMIDFPCIFHTLIFTSDETMATEKRNKFHSESERFNKHE